MIEIRVLDTPSLGDRSYLVTDGEVAVAIDPQRDIDRVLDLARTSGVRITHVAETHIHNDYVTGGFALARRVGAEYLVAADEDVGFARRPVRDGDVITTGGLRLRALHTPGHTFTHLAYVLEDGDRRVHAVFTGGSLLFGSTGRPDLFGAQHTETLARHQHASAHRLARVLPDTTPVFPTHGFGSFCSASPTHGSSSTLAEECRNNPALTEDEDAFVAGLLDGLGAYPAYYAHMAPLNAAGPPAVEPTPAAARRPGRVAAADPGRRVGGRPAAAGGVRGGSPAREPQFRARRQLPDLPGLADPVGHPGVAGGLHARRRPGRRPGAQPHRHRPGRGDGGR